MSVGVSWTYLTCQLLPLRHATIHACRHGGAARRLREGDRSLSVDSYRVERYQELFASPHHSLWLRTRLWLASQLPPLPLMSTAIASSLNLSPSTSGLFSGDGVPIGVAGWGGC